MKAKLDELSRIMGLPGKPDGIDGSQVEAYHNAGRIQEIADYCRSDVLNTYRVWLRHELFRGRLKNRPSSIIASLMSGDLPPLPGNEPTADDRCWGKSRKHAILQRLRLWDRGCVKTPPML